MLKNVPKNISPDLLKILSEMGHGDELVIADGNFPSKSLNEKTIRYDGNSIPQILASILEIYPLDSYVENQVMLMGVNEDDNYDPIIWDEYKKILDASGEPHKVKYLKRFEFYERAKQSYAIIATGEEALYANVILKKGVVK